MILNRSFISYMARELAKRLGKESLEVSDPQPLRERFENVLIDELSLEDEINAEARELLNQYTDYMRQQRIPYQEMFAKVKRQVLAERKMTSAQDPLNDIMENIVADMAEQSGRAPRRPVYGTSPNYS